MIKLSATVRNLINIFTLIETVVLTIWVLILFPSLLHLAIVQQSIAFTVLYFGLLLEHTQSVKAGVLAGKDNP